MKIKILATLLTVLMLSFVNGEEVTIILPDSLEWKDMPRPGVQEAHMFGDPNQPEQPYTFRVRLPANFEGKPHMHNQHEYMTVISGSLYVGIGSTLDKNTSIRLPAGGAAGVPPQVYHYIWTDEETVMQVHSLGNKNTINVPKN